MMKKTLLFLVVGCLLATSAVASTNTGSKVILGNWAIVTIPTPSAAVAQNAIDTTIVDVSDALWEILQDDDGTVVVSHMAFYTSFEGGASMDSVNTQWDYGYDYLNNPQITTTAGLQDQNWTALYTLANTATTMTAAAPTLSLLATVPAPLLRIAVKQVDAAALGYVVVIAYRVRPEYSQVALRSR